MGKILGIDLGTTNSVVAVMDRNGPFVVPNSVGERLTPSVVGFARSGEVLVGKKAKRGAVMNVGRTVFSIKRHMGSNYRVRIEGKEYTPQEISGMILQKLKQDAEEYFGEECDQAIITVPAYFTDAQRQATKDAGEIAGLNVRRIIDEPTAAALAYGLDKKADQTIMVYDLGGGTFDVSIIEVISGVFKVLAISGNTHLGGDDFDNRIVQHLIAEFKETYGVDLSTDPIAMQRLKEAAEEAKMELSEIKETQIVVEAIHMSDKGPLTLSSKLTRDQFEKLIEDLIHQTIPCMNRALEDANLKPEQIDTVLLVGGSTRIPAVRELVRKTMNKQPHRDISPEEVVALGAAVETMVLVPLGGTIEDSLAARYGKDKPVIIHITPFSLGVGIEHDQFVPIIERNSTYPTEAKDVFTTTRDFQEAISFPIYEGEEPIASENTFLDMLRIEGITPAPRGVARVEVTFRLNADRILEARAEDLATGVEKKIVIEATDTRLSESEKLRMIKEARERVTAQLCQRIGESIHEQASAMLERADGLVTARPDHSMTHQVSLIADQLRAALEQGDHKKIQPILEELIHVVDQIETAGAG
ncbi:MAG: molecular chaperone DnaK [Candidatus Sumerlaeia bacterium]|nr:molecular chaperone DnaK [Candidatus Sumerlaeia bacterium]